MAAAFAHRDRRLGPIGVFDSGIGGGSVLLHLHKLLPAEDLRYLADQAHCPYGLRHVDEIRMLSLQCTEMLLDHGAKSIIVACNTASTAALSLLRERYPTIPIVGMVPAVKPAVLQSRSGVVGILATPTTIHGELLNQVVERFANGVKIIRCACDGLVEQIEAGAVESADTEKLLRGYLTPLLAAGVDTLVLGCTHYPFVRTLIEQIAGPDVAIIDAGPAVARQAARVLTDHGLLHPQPTRSGMVTYLTTAEPGALAELIQRLGLPVGNVLATSRETSPQR